MKKKTTRAAVEVDEAKSSVGEVGGTRAAHRKREGWKKKKRRKKTFCSLLLPLPTRGVQQRK